MLALTRTAYLKAHPELVDPKGGAANDGAFTR